MPESTLLPELIVVSAGRAPDVRALTYGAASLTYGELCDQMQRFAAGVLALGLQRGERVAIYLEKRFETAVGSFGAAAAGGVFVPVNPLLKPEQVAFILQDCNVRFLLTSPDRLPLLAAALAECPDLRHVLLTDAAAAATPDALLPGSVTKVQWSELLAHTPRPGHRAAGLCPRPDRPPRDAAHHVSDHDAERGGELP